MNLKIVLRGKNSFLQFGIFFLTVGLIFLLFYKTETVVAPVLPIPTSTPSFIIAKVAKVLDGDSFLLASGEEVRYIGIDTPEIQNRDCYAKEATAENKNLVLEKEIKLVRDTSETDKYGRLLRYVYLGDVLVNDYLVKNGFAKVMTVPPDIQFEDQFSQSERYAKENRLGLWAKCFQE